MIETVEVTANYDQSKQVPRIGQRKRMRVNGRMQMMTLNELTVNRHHAWDEETGTKQLFWYESKETWGGFYNSFGP